MTTSIFGDVTLASTLPEKSKTFQKFGPRLRRIVARSCAMLCAVLVLASLSPGAGAQVLYGSLTGTVTDPTGAVVPGAQVKCSNVSTGVSAEATTDPAGIYRFASLLPGTYEVTITAMGFTTQQTPSVVINLNQIARVDAALQVAKAATSVTVTTAAPLLQTETANVQTEITTRQLQYLPIMGSQGANFQSVLRTIPGAGLTAETNSLAGNPQRAINTNVNGVSNQGVNTRIDGVQDAYPWLPANVAYVPPADAIDTVNVVTNSFTAEQGMAGGAAVNLQIKSGTNEFHGDAHAFHTDQNFAARNYFQTDTTRFPHKNRNNQNQFGGAIGGPILRNKLFFFGDYERTTQRQLAGPQTRTLPTSDMAKGIFTNLPGNPIIYDPATGDAHGNNKQQISCNGELNVICPTRIDPAAAQMVTLLKDAIAKETATANDLNNFNGSSTALFNRDNSDVKVTYIPSDKTSVWGRYSFSKTLVYDPPLLGAAVGDATNGGQLGDAPGLVQLVGVGITHAFSPTLLFDWNLGFTRQRLGSTFDLSSAKGLEDLKIPGTNDAGAPGNKSMYYGLPGFIFPTATDSPGTSPPSGVTSGAALGNAQPANPFLFRDQQYVTGANLSWLKKKHAFRGGIEWNHTQLNHFQPQGGAFQQPRGSFEFNGYVTSQTGTTPNWFNSWADFLLGLPSGTGKARADFNPNALRWTQWAWYLQDQWQITPKITVTLGARWEYYPFGYSDNDKGLRVLDLNTGNVLLGGYGGVPRNDGIDVGSGQFLPRVGFAYRVTPSTVIRTGYGMSADPYTWHVLRNAYPAVLLDTNAPAKASDHIPAASLTGLNGTGLGKDDPVQTQGYSVFTGVKLAPLPDLSSGKIPLPTNISTTTLPNPFHRGFINSYNLTVEQQLWKDFTFNVGYVGTYVVRPVVNMNANASAPGTGSAGGILSQRFGANYTGTINYLNPFKFSRYDSLQTKATYRFAGGSNVIAAYTWSKAMNFADNEDLGSLLIPYPGAWQKDYAVSGYDRTNNLEITGVLAMPFGKEQRWLQSGVGSAILGGWLVNPMISAMSGQPFYVSAGGSLSANGSTQTADLVKPFHLAHGKPPRTGVSCAQTDPTCHYFDASSFAAPLITGSTDAHFGNTNRNQFRGPGYFSMNLSIVRDFKIREYATLELRGDAFSLTNTPHFGNPGISCPGDAKTAGPVAGSGQLCTTGSNNNFGVITGTASPGGYFGPDPGNRVVWLGATVRF